MRINPFHVAGVVMLGMLGSCATPARQQPREPSAASAVVMPKWQNCPSTHETDGLLIKCEGAVVAQIVDGDPALPVGDYQKSLEATLGVPLKAAETTVRVNDKQRRAYRMEPTDPERDVAALLVLVDDRADGRRRRMECVTRRSVEFEKVCLEIFAHFGGGADLATFQAAKPDVPWGCEKTDDASNTRLQTLLSMAQEPGRARPLFGDTVVFGPGLFHWLVLHDPGFATINKPSTLLSANPPVPMGTYVKGEIDKVLAAPAVAKLFRQLAGGQVRAATTEERHLFYTEIPYEIDHQPISVIARGQLILLVDLHDGKPAWMELFTDSDLPAEPEVP